MSNETSNAYFDEFTKPVRKIGKLSLLVAIILSFLPAIYIAIAYNCMPTIAQIIGGYVMILSTEAVYYFVEPISYFPVLGEAGTYMSFLAGSIGGIRVPSVTVSQNSVGTEPGSQKAELVSSIAVAASVLCSMLMGFIAIVLGNLLFASMPKFVQSMFTYVVPALYGTLLMMYVPKKPIVAVFGLAIALLLRITKIIPGAFNMLLVVILTVAFGLYMFKNKQKKAALAAGASTGTSSGDQKK